MKLFKRILLSLFPQPEGDLQINPATLFVNFVSAKQFFSIVLRKLVENYKLYLYDINFDSFEVKIWFWDTPTLKLMEIEDYFSYISSSEFNWYRFFSPINVSTIFSLLAAYRFNSIFRKYNYRLFLNFLVTVNFVFYIFMARFKVFDDDKQESYKKFIEIFFNLYQLTNQETKLKISTEVFETIKKELLKDMEFFMSLFYIVYRFWNIFDYHNVWMKEKDFFERLFYDEISSGKYKNVIRDFLDNLEYYQSNIEFSLTEKTLMNLILPADVIVRFFFWSSDIFEIVDNILWEIFKDWKVDKLLQDVLRDEKNLKNLILYLTDYRLYRKSFFRWVKKFIFKSLEVKDKSLAEEIFEDLISTIGWEVKIPESIRKQWAIAEKMMNFYLSFIWGFWIWRAETYYHKLFKKELIDEMSISLWIDFSQDVLYILGWLVYMYWKNVFYYQYAFESVRQWKDTFRLPLRPSFKEVYSSPMLIHLFTESCIVTFFEELNIKDIKLYITNSEIIKLFSTMFKENINRLINLDIKDFVKEFFYVFKVLEVEDIDIAKYIDENEIKFLKEHLYTLEFWVWNEVLNYVKENIINKNGFKIIWKMAFVYILAILKQTLFGFLILLTAFKQFTNRNKDVRIDILRNIYIRDIVILPKKDDFEEIFNNLIDYLLKKYNKFLVFLIKIDDNQKFLKILYENWTSLLNSVKEPDEIPSLIRGEDLVWFRNVLKSISFYNKRFYIPQI